MEIIKLFLGDIILHWWPNTKMEYEVGAFGYAKWILALWKYIICMDWYVHYKLGYLGCSSNLELSFNDNFLFKI